MGKRRQGLNVTVIVQDETWRKIGTFKWNENDLKTKNRVIKTLKDKYNMKFRVVDEDLSWI